MSNLLPVIVTFIAPPGAGKGTQATLLSQILGIPHLSTGAMIRAKEGQTDEIALALAESSRTKSFAPDGIMIAMICQRTAQEDCEGGFILDGFPRTLEQATMLDEMLVNRGHKLIPIELQVGEGILAERITHRLTCKNCEAIFHKKTHPPLHENICDVCNQETLYTRPEDTLEILQGRLKDYHDKTAKILDFYRQNGRLISVNGIGETDEVSARIQKLLP